MASRRWIGLQPKYLQLTPLPAAQSVGIVKRPSLNSRLALSTLAHTVISGLLAAPGGLDNQCHVPAAALHYRFNMTFADLGYDPLHLFTLEWHGSLRLGAESELNGEGRVVPSQYAETIRFFLANCRVICGHGGTSIAKLLKSKVLCGVSGRFSLRQSTCSRSFSIIRRPLANH